MLNAVKIFDESIAEARNLTVLYGYLADIPHNFDDLLRSQVVYAVGAFDKLIHDLVRIGMVEEFVGSRAPTDRFQAEPISIKFHGILVEATIPPKEHLFEQEVARKLALLSFQNPEKVVEGLSLIWSEGKKWAKIAAKMEWNADEARTKLKLIADRRNAIVHQSDINPIINTKTPISAGECADVTDFVQLCGRAIGELVK